MGQAAEKIREAQKLTAGAKARKYFRRLNGTTEVVPSQMPFWRASLAGQPKAGRPYAGGVTLDPL